jgi:hypothetical protein
MDFPSLGIAETANLNSCNEDGGEWSRGKYFKGKAKAYQFFIPHSPPGSKIIS